MRFFSISPSHRRTALCSSLPDLQAVAKEVLAGIFFGFSANLEVTEQKGFELTGHFTLAASTNGINPVSEQVALQIGTFWVLIPPASFSINKNGRFEFEGVINGVNLEIRITPLANNSFTFKAEGRGVNLTALTNPVTVAITIGNDTGLTTVTAEHN
jgi:hypothetical protein